MIDFAGDMNFADIKPGQYFRSDGRLFIKLQTADPEDEFDYAFDIGRRQPCIVADPDRVVEVATGYIEFEAGFVWEDRPTNDVP